MPATAPKRAARSTRGPRNRPPTLPRAAPAAKRRAASPTRVSKALSAEGYFYPPGARTYSSG